MALGDILEAIRRDAAGEVERIVADERQRAEAVLAEAVTVARRREREMAEARDEELADAARAVRNRAHLEVARRLQTAQEKVFQTALEQARRQLAALRTQNGYQTVFAGLVQECREALPVGNILKIDPRDQTLATQLIGDAHPDWTVEASLSSWGGIELHTDDGRRALNTLEARLERAGPLLRRAFAERMPPTTGSRP